MRSIVIKEVFDKECEILKDFEWDVLSYPTALSFSQNTIKPIKNLEQLKRVVSIEEKEVINPDISIEVYNDDIVEETTKDNVSFKILCLLKVLTYLI